MGAHRVSRQAASMFDGIKACRGPDHNSRPHISLPSAICRLPESHCVSFMASRVMWCVVEKYMIVSDSAPPWQEAFTQHFTFLVRSIPWQEGRVAGTMLATRFQLVELIHLG
jgi:hypothetical protein